MQVTQVNTGRERVYKGSFKDGRLDGQDCEVEYVNEKEGYVGAFREGRKCGKGTYFYADGRTWQGQWKDNRQNGIGRYKNVKGVVIEGYWIDGIKS